MVAYSSDSARAAPIMMAKILKPHGLLGAMRLRVFTAEHGEFIRYKTFLLRNKRYHVDYFKQAGKHLIVKLATIDNVDAAAALRGEYLALNREDIPLTSSQLLISDLMHTTVYVKLATSRASSCHAAAVLVGKVVAYYEAGGTAAGMLEITLDQSFQTYLAPREQQRNSFLLPCSKWYIGDFDHKNQCFYLKHADELLEWK